MGFADVRCPTCKQMHGTMNNVRRGPCEERHLRQRIAEQAATIDQWKRDYRAKCREALTAQAENERLRRGWLNTIAEVVRDLCGADTLNEQEIDALRRKMLRRRDERDAQGGDENWYAPHCATCHCMRKAKGGDDV